MVYKQHAVTYPISDTHTNVLYFDTVRGGLGQPLTGPSMAAASKEEIVELFKDWDEDLRVGAEVSVSACRSYAVVPEMLSCGPECRQDGQVGD